MAKAKQQLETATYRNYIADTLYFRLAKEKVVNVRYCEILNPPPEETRTADEIIEGIRTKIERLVNK